MRCGGAVRLQQVEPQYQEEIVRLTVVRRIDVEVGRCQRCGARAQGRHPLQTSDALGAAQVQLGPEALALGAHLNKQVGLSLGQTTQVLQLGFGLQVSRAGIYRALARMAGKAAPTYQQLIGTARQSLVNWMDETGWRVGGRSQWLWVAVSEEVTVYAILPGRGFEEAASLLGADYDGWLLHDGLRLYYGFEKANHQSCLAYLIRRCRDMLAVSSAGAAGFPQQVKSLLQQALRLRDRHAQGEITGHGLAVATGRLEARLDEFLSRTFRTPPNLRLAKHLRHEQPYLFTFLHCPGLEATNNRAERAIRPTVAARTLGELLEWKRPGGGLKNHECRQLLERLEQRGWLRLPEVRARGPRGPRRVRFTSRSAPQAELDSTAGEYEPLRLRVVERYHYLGYRVPVGAQLRYLVR
ncbi:MAG: transposase, partial [Acidobacteriota bacterium]